MKKKQLNFDMAKVAFERIVRKCRVVICGLLIGASAVAAPLAISDMRYEEMSEDKVEIAQSYMPVDLSSKTENIVRSISIPTVSESLIESLRSNNGELLTNDELTAYGTAMSNFNKLPSDECFATYSHVNKFIRSSILLGHDIWLNTTFFTERESDIIAFSINLGDDNIFTGRGSAAEIAVRTISLLSDIEKELG